MQTREYLENYWLLFLDFIKEFKDLKYCDVPLPLLANFYQYLDANVKKQLNSPDFKQQLTESSLPTTQTQPAFENWLEQFKKPLSTKPLKGKILLNFAYLRFTPNSYRHFDPNKTVIFAGWEKDYHHGIPVHCIKKYNPVVNKELDYYFNQTQKLFNKVKSHQVFGNQFFYNTFMQRLPMMIEGLAAVNNYFDKNDISCVIVGTTEDLISRILTLIAAKRGIPSICLQHGMLGGDEAYVPAFATIVGVFGNYEKTWYLEMGLPEERIAITGHPRFDDIFAVKHMSKKVFQKSFGLDPQKKTVLLLTQPYFTPLWERLLDVLVTQTHSEIVIKPHPIELRKNRDVDSMAIYQKYAEKSQSIKVITQKDVVLNDLLANVDVVVTNLSTGGMEAVLFDKPLLLLTDVHFPFFDHINDFIFSDPKQLAEQIDSQAKISTLRNSSKEIRKKFIQYAYPQKLSSPILLETVKRITNN